MSGDSKSFDNERKKNRGIKELYQKIPFLELNAVRQILDIALVNSNSAEQRVYTNALTGLQKLLEDRAVIDDELDENLIRNCSLMKCNHCGVISHRSKSMKKSFSKKSISPPKIEKEKRKHVSHIPQLRHNFKDSVKSATNKCCTGQMETNRNELLPTKKKCNRLFKSSTKPVIPPDNNNNNNGNIPKVKNASDIAESRKESNKQTKEKAKLVIDLNNLECPKTIFVDAARNSSTVEKRSSGRSSEGEVSSQFKRHGLNLHNNEPGECSKIDFRLNDQKYFCLRSKEHDEVKQEAKKEKAFQVSIVDEDPHYSDVNSSSSSAENLIVHWLNNSLDSKFLMKDINARMISESKEIRGSKFVDDLYHPQKTQFLFQTNDRDENQKNGNDINKLCMYHTNNWLRKNDRVKNKDPEHDVTLDRETSLINSVIHIDRSTKNQRIGNNPSTTVHKKSRKSTKEADWKAFKKIVKTLCPSQSELWSDICKAVNKEARRLQQKDSRTDATAEICIEMHPFIREGNDEEDMREIDNEVVLEMDLALNRNEYERLSKDRRRISGTKQKMNKSNEQRRVDNF